MCVYVCVYDAHRFVPQLRGDGAQMLVDILRGLCILGGDQEEADKAREVSCTTAVCQHT